MKEGVAATRTTCRPAGHHRNRVGDKIVPRRSQALRPGRPVSRRAPTRARRPSRTTPTHQQGIRLLARDAFAGARGYDHKPWALRARRGSPSSATSRDGIDTQTSAFTVAASATCRATCSQRHAVVAPHPLLAAFDHRSLSDPQPDPRRLRRARAAVQAAAIVVADYDAKLISAGGGVHSRSAKSIQITPEVKRALGIAAMR